MSYVASASRTIHVPAAVAFDRLADHDSWASWMPASFRPVGRPLGRLAEGTTFRVRILGAPFASRCHVTVVRPHEEITWCGGIRGLVYAEHHFFFDAAGDGVTVRSEETWSGPVASLLRPAIQRGAARVGGETIDGLARAVS
ncbi:MAG TPA: SRPBCC family protein [Polyangiaceae bacterium]